MKNNLTKVIANDMNIKRFTSETECEYNQRLIYSVGAAWVKALVYGHSYADVKSNVSYVNTDIMYIETHLAKILEAYLQCFAINEDWLDKDGISSITEKASALASQIIKEVIYTYNLAEIQSRRLAPLPKQYYKYDKNLYLVRGENEMTNTVYSVGVAQWIIGDGINDYKIDNKIISIKGKEYYQVMNLDFAWEKANLQSSYLIFRTGSKGGYSKCWKPVNVMNLPQRISILRLDNEFNGGYVLVKRKEDRLLMAELDPWYIEEREIYRILYALNYENQTPAEFKVKKKDGFYILKYSSAIPVYEDRVITCCSWPYVTFDDKYSKLVPEFLWKIVERLITELGIKIIYQ